MSAIFGILDLRGRPIDPAWIKSMQKDLSHRGPDGQGLYREGSLVLGNMMLQVTPESIYDKSPYEEDGLVITANARLDEREALMDRLKISLAERGKITDPVLLLRSYRLFGKDFVKNIYGDFTFAIWDKENKKLFCARDQMGVKPFLYYFQDNRLVFSTELKAIVKLPFVVTSFDHLLLRDEAIGIYDKPNKTVWKNIVRLSAASTLSLKGFEITSKLYWKPTYKRNPKYKTADQSAAALREILERVISDHTRVIGRIGVPLSGGLDSSTIACLAAKKMALNGKNITTASSILDPHFKETGVKDELEYIEAVIRQEKNIDSTFILHSNLGFLENLDEKFNRHYAPFNNSHYIDEAIYNEFESKSIKRVLSGFLGDITASNSTIYPLPLLLIAGRFKSFFHLSRLIKIQSKQTLFSHVINNIVIPILPMFFLNALYRIKGNKISWNIDSLPLNLSTHEKQQLQKRKIAYFKNYLIHQLEVSRNIWPAPDENFEEDWDCGASHHHIEITYPMTDRRVVEYLLQLPVEHFSADGHERGLIKKAMAGILPEKIRQRKDKYPYSPAYHQIIKKDILQIKAFLLDVNSNIQLGNMIDIPKMNTQLDNFVQSKTHRNFTGDYSSILGLSMWIVLNKWLVNKKPD